MLAPFKFDCFNFDHWVHVIVYFPLHQSVIQVLSINIISIWRFNIILFAKSMVHQLHIELCYPWVRETKSIVADLRRDSFTAHNICYMFRIENSCNWLIGRNHLMNCCCITSKNLVKFYNVSMYSNKVRFSY
jgi:hypothetical protein